MSGVEVISSTTIRAANHNNDKSPQKIDLNPWDIQFLPFGAIQQGLLFDNPKLKIDIVIKYMKMSLASTLDFFPPLAGRLEIIPDGAGADDNSASVFINCNNEGALLVHARAQNTTVADILEPTYVPRIVHSFFSLNGVRNFEGVSKPLLSVQVNELADGIFFGCTINHAVADGPSLYHFFDSWSEVIRAFDKLSKPPVFERWFHDGIIPHPLRIPLIVENNDSDGNVSQPIVPPERVFHFSKGKIEELKAKANAEAASSVEISSLQALLTHIWRSVIRSRFLEPEEEVNCSLVIDIRPRMRSSLPENYFANALQVGTITMKAGELLEEGGLGRASQEMNKMVSLHKQEKIESDFESWVKKPRLFTVTEMAGNSLVTSSSPKFELYRYDFGWGKPLAIRCGPSNKSHGKLTVFGGAEEGSIDVEVCLPMQILEAMGNDSEFMGFVSNLN